MTSRIFLIANGPSLAKTPLDKLIGEESWGMSRIQLIYAHTEWRPTRYFWSDHPQDQEGMDDVLFHIEQDYECWVRRDVCEIITGNYIPSGPLIDGKWHYPALWAPEPRSLPDNIISWDHCRDHNAGFIRNMDGSEDNRRSPGWHEGPLCKYGSGLNVMLQQAARERFNPIYLLGADLGYQAGDANHFSIDYHSWEMEQERAVIENDTQVEMHTHAKEWCDERGIRILNAGLGGELEVYPRVDFNSLF